MTLFQIAGAGLTVATLFATAANMAVNIDPIVVHSLKYEDGRVVQDRTVVAEEGRTFFAHWEAQIVNADTGATIDDCAGEGFWDYAPGRVAVKMDLPRWTGNENCTSDDLPERFYLRAIWKWGAQSTRRESQTYNSVKE